MMERLGPQDDALVVNLLRARHTRQPLPAPAADSLEHAYLLQRLHTERLLALEGGWVIGMKLGGTNVQALATLGLKAPFRGPIFSRHCHRSPARLPANSLMVGIVEAEIGMRLGKELGGSEEMPGIDELRDAVDTVFPAIEVADSRYLAWSNAPASAIVADLAYAGAWVRGQDCPTWRNLNLAGLPVQLTADDQLVREGSGAMVLGDPWHALALAVAEHGRSGARLRAGDVVSTGTCTVPFVVEGATRFIADFASLGTVELRLT